MAQTKLYLTLERRWWFKPAFYVGAALVALGLIDGEPYVNWLADHAIAVVTSDNP